MLCRHACPENLGTRILLVILDPLIASSVVRSQPADSDEAGRVFRLKSATLFRWEAGRRSDEGGRGRRRPGGSFCVISHRIVSGQVCKMMGCGRPRDPREGPARRGAPSSVAGGAARGRDQWITGASACCSVYRRRSARHGACAGSRRRARCDRRCGRCDRGWRQRWWDRRYRHKAVQGGPG